MYILGHLITSLRAGRISSSAIFGVEGPALYLPDFCRCHGWGYENCFVIPETCLKASLVKAHLLGDWWIHFGRGPEQKRRGWAYRRMAAFSCEYEKFYEVARRQGLLAEEKQESVRGFSHTMAEYSVDIHLASTITSAEFQLVKQQISLLATTDPIWSIEGICATIRELGIRAESQALATDVGSFRARVEESCSPHEFVYRAGVKKFGLHPRRESRELVARVIEKGLSRIAATEMDQVVAGASGFIADHTSVCWEA